MLRKLREVQTLPDSEATDILDLDPVAAQIFPASEDDPQ